MFNFPREVAVRAIPKEEDNETASNGCFPQWNRRREKDHSPSRQVLGRCTMFRVKRKVEEDGVSDPPEVFIR